MMNGDYCCGAKYNENLVDVLRLIVATKHTFIALMMFVSSLKFLLASYYAIFLKDTFYNS